MKINLKCFKNNHMINDKSLIILIFVLFFLSLFFLFSHEVFADYSCTTSCCSFTLYSTVGCTFGTCCCQCYLGTCEGFPSMWPYQFSVCGNTCYWYKVSDCTTDWFSCATRWKYRDTNKPNWCSANFCDTTTKQYYSGGWPDCHSGGWYCYYPSNFCDTSHCGADSACNGKMPGDSCTSGGVPGVCNTNCLCSLTGCSGIVSLALSPSTISPSGTVTATASGLDTKTNCNGKTVYFKKDSCSGTQVAICTVSGAGCSSTFIAPSTSGTYNYYACVDMNGINGFSDSGESSSAPLSVVTGTNCRCTGYGCDTFDSNKANCQGAGCSWTDPTSNSCSGSPYTCSHWNGQGATCGDYGCSYCYNAGICASKTDFASCSGISCCLWIPVPPMCLPTHNTGDCFGTAAPCASWTGSGSIWCTSAGCTWHSATPSDCSGSSQSCNSYSTQLACSTYGCIWCSGGTCYNPGGSTYCSDQCAAGATSYRCSGNTVQRNTCIVNTCGSTPTCTAWTGYQNVVDCTSKNGCCGTTCSKGGTDTYCTYTCSGGACTPTTTPCRCDAVDTDIPPANGLNYTVSGICTNYSGCIGGSCISKQFEDYCIDRNTLNEYYVSGNSCVNITTTPGLSGLGWQTVCSSIKKAITNVTTYVSILPTAISYTSQNVTIGVLFDDPDYRQGENVSINLTIYLDGTYREWDVSSNCISEVMINASGTNQNCNWKWGMDHSICNDTMTGSEMTATSQDGHFEIKAICQIPSWLPYGTRTLRAVPTYYSHNVTLTSAETKIYIQIQEPSTVTPLQATLIFLRTIFKGINEVFTLPLILI